MKAAKTFPLSSDLLSLGVSDSRKEGLHLKDRVRDEKCMASCTLRTNSLKGFFYDTGSVNILDIGSFYDQDCLHKPLSSTNW